MALDIAAKIADLDEWGPGKTRSRYDYDTSEHLFAEIRQMGPEYFGRYCWARLRPGDVILTSDPFKCSASISHTNDWLVLVPIFYEDELVGWSSQFGHQMDCGGPLPGSLPTGARTPVPSRHAAGPGSAAGAAPAAADDGRALRAVKHVAWSTTGRSGLILYHRR